MSDNRLIIDEWKVELINSSSGNGLGAAYARIYEKERAQLPDYVPPEVWPVKRALLFGPNIARYMMSATLHYGRIEDIYESNSLVYEYDIKFARDDKKFHWFPYFPVMNYDDKESSFFLNAPLVNLDAGIVFLTEQSAEQMKEMSAKFVDLQKQLGAAPLVFAQFVVKPEQLPSEKQADRLNERLKQLSQIFSHSVPLLSKGSPVTAPVVLYNHVIFPTPEGQHDFLSLIISTLHSGLSKDDDIHHHHHHCIIS